MPSTSTDSPIRSNSPPRTSSTKSAPLDSRERSLDALKAVLTEWTSWFRAEHAGWPGRCWDGPRLEYEFGLDVATPTGIAALHAPAHGGGHVSWVSLEGNATRTPFDGEVPTFTPLKGRALANRLSYLGMPAVRFWQFEDSAVNIAALDPQVTDLAHLLLAEFGLQGADDWYVVPLDVPVNTCTAIDRLTYTTTFGETLEVRPLENRPSEMSQLFTVGCAEDAFQTNEPLPLCPDFSSWPGPPAPSRAIRSRKSCSFVTKWRTPRSPSSAKYRARAAVDDHDSTKSPTTHRQRTLCPPPTAPIDSPNQRHRGGTATSPCSGLTCLLAPACTQPRRADRVEQSSPTGRRSWRGSSTPRSHATAYESPGADRSLARQTEPTQVGPPDVLKSAEAKATARSPSTRQRSITDPGRGARHGLTDPITRTSPRRRRHRNPRRSNNSATSAAPPPRASCSPDPCPAPNSPAKSDESTPNNALPHPGQPFVFAPADDDRSVPHLDASRWQRRKDRRGNIEDGP